MGGAHQRFNFRRFGHILRGDDHIRFPIRLFLGDGMQKRPVLAFGNSSGDFSMLNYAAGNTGHAGMGFLVVADDTEREYGNPNAADMAAKASEQGWTAISMKGDWATIYGEGVQKTSLRADEAQQLDAAA